MIGVCLGDMSMGRMRIRTIMGCMWYPRISWIASIGWIKIRYLNDKEDKINWASTKNRTQLEYERRLLDGVLELAQVVHNCYSKRRLVNFYSLVNYIHLQPQTREKYSCSNVVHFFWKVWPWPIERAPHHQFENHFQINAIRRNAFEEFNFIADARFGKPILDVLRLLFISLFVKYIYSRSEIPNGTPD